MGPTIFAAQNFDQSAAYFGALVGLGQVFAITDLTDLDVYGGFNWTRTNSQEFRLLDNSRMKFDSVNSYQTRLGTRLTQVYMKGDLKGYVGAGWEQLAGAEAGGHSS